MSGFRKAVKTDRMLRLALVGTTGSGKTYTALRIARGIAAEMGGGLIGVIDSERDSASLYADDFDFVTAPIRTGNPNEYVERIEEAKREGIDVLVIDSMSHAWIGQEGALRLVDKAAAKTQSKNTFAAWRTVTPQHDAFVAAVLDYPGHVIATMRLKMAYELQENERGKKEPVKIGLQPVERDGVEYEFDLVGDIDQAHVFRVSKTRYSGLDGAVITKPGEELGAELVRWLKGERKPVTELGRDELRAELASIQRRHGDAYAEIVEHEPQTLREARDVLERLRARTVDA
ncbi:MAG: ATP-binding protein [Deltaproteobacteria bacterium]